METGFTYTQFEEPRFPPELEREIFEIAAPSLPMAIPTLMLIASRVRDWVEPLLYRVIIVIPSWRHISGFPVVPIDTLLRKIVNKPQSFFAGARHMLLNGAIEAPSIEAILAACPGVTNLISHSYLAYSLHALGGLQCLRRLAV
ncbi:hypothetical protein B0H19DRAFT_658249 [Mycena capillaripes]|nr:hypothetical protein B0H19DRAFT_658249 [Mycena capillaripes]